MIRFRTVEPGAPETPLAKAVVPAVPAPVIVAEPATEDAPASGDTASIKGKGLARKTPLRAKKPDTARLFRD